MNTVDVAADVEIAASPAEIAAVMFDPAREPDWVQAVRSVEIIDPALAPGARVRHSGSFLGQEFAWTTEVERVQFPHLLVLRVSEGPLAGGTVQYGIQRSGIGSRVQVRNTADGGVLGGLPPALVTPPIKAALARSLDRLKAIVEGA
jgi:uncharacterized protein YndB with AHSA1/START domain